MQIGRFKIHLIFFFCFPYSVGLLDFFPFCRMARGPRLGMQIPVDGGCGPPISTFQSDARSGCIERPDNDPRLSCQTRICQRHRRTTLRLAERRDPFGDL